MTTQVTTPTREVNYDCLPEHMQDGARLYIEQGIPPGGFLMAVLCNDLVGAVGRADAVNQSRLVNWALWLHNDIPMAAWGSLEKVQAWMAAVREDEREGARG